VKNFSLQESIYFFKVLICTILCCLKRNNEDIKYEMGFIGSVDSCFFKESDCFANTSLHKSEKNFLRVMLLEEKTINKIIQSFIFYYSETDKLISHTTARLCFSEIDKLVSHTTARLCFSEIDKLVSHTTARLCFSERNFLGALPLRKETVK